MLRNGGIWKDEGETSDDYDPEEGDDDGDGGRPKGTGIGFATRLLMAHYSGAATRARGRSCSRGNRMCDRSRIPSSRASGRTKVTSSRSRDSRRRRTAGVWEDEDETSDDGIFQEDNDDDDGSGPRGTGIGSATGSQMATCSEAETRARERSCNRGNRTRDRSRSRSSCAPDGTIVTRSRRRCIRMLETAGIWEDEGETFDEYDLEEGDDDGGSNDPMGTGIASATSSQMAASSSAATCVRDKSNSRGNRTCGRSQSHSNHARHGMQGQGHGSRMCNSEVRSTFTGFPTPLLRLGVPATADKAVTRGTPPTLPHGDRRFAGKKQDRVRPKESRVYVCDKCYEEKRYWKRSLPYDGQYLDVLGVRRRTAEELKAAYYAGEVNATWWCSQCHRRPGESLEICRVRLGLYDLDRMERTQRHLDLMHRRQMFRGRWP